MKLLAVGFSCHDANMTYFDGYKVHYYKRERKTKNKHDQWSDLWEWKYVFEEHFKVSVNDIDQIAFEITFFPPSDEDESLSLFRNKQPSGYSVNKYLPYFSDNTIEKFISLFKGDINYFKCPNDVLNMYQHNKDNIWIVSHYYLHALSAWMLTDKEPDVYITMDGLSDYYNSGKIFRNDKEELEVVCSLPQGGVGDCYLHLSYLLGIDSPRKDFRDLDNPGKLMSLQSYGHVDNIFLDIIKDYNIENITNKYYSIRNTANFDVWKYYKQNDLLAEVTKIDFAASLHKKYGEYILEIFKKYAKPHETIVYAGGVAQNVCWNTMIKQHFPNLIIPPHSSDEGLSLGGIEFLRRMFNLPKFEMNNFPYIQLDIAPDSNPSEETIDMAAKLLSNGYTVGWYQGNGECGPRALGNRSILFDPRITNGKSIVNCIKNRENYRPFGASVLKEYQDEYFDLGWDDDFMLYTSKVKKELPAITHVDGTCRIHTVKNANSSFRKLLERFNEITGCPVLLNTSLNISGKGLAGYPEEAIELLYMTPLNYMVIGDKIYGKKK